MIFESDKFVLTKGGMYGYLVDGLFKANVIEDSKESVYFQRLEADENCSRVSRVQRQGPRKQEQALQGDLLHLQQRGI